MASSGVEDRIETHQSEGAVTGEEEEEENRGPPAFLPCPLSHSLRGASQKPGFRTTVHIQECCSVLSAGGAGAEEGKRAQGTGDRASALEQVLLCSWDIT